MGKRIGVLGGVSSGESRIPSSHCTSGLLSLPFQGKRLFSVGSVSIGSFRIDGARVFWDTGSKQTFLFVPDLTRIDAPMLGEFPVSGIGAEETAYAYEATLDLSGGIVFDGHVIGVMLSDSPDDSFDSTDVIIGMDIIQRGSFHVDGIKRTFSFRTK